MDLVSSQSQTPKKLIFLVTFFCIFFWLLTASVTKAATLNFSTGQGYSVGQTFPVKVTVSTAGESINAVSAVISFDPTQLTLVSLSQTPSIVSMWASQPTFSNLTGSADLEGVILNPGYSGQNGTLATLTFKVRSAGSTQLTFSQASVLANDGLATNVLTSAPPKVISLGLNPAPDATTNDHLAPGAPAAPVITSTTNPDPTKWSNNPNPTFSWVVPADVTHVRVSFDTSPIATPSVAYEKTLTTKTLSGVSDGVYYLHAQFENKSGWGAIAHYKFSIDTVAPATFQISQADPNDKYNPRPILLFKTTDALSGMDHYSVKIGDTPAQLVDAATVASDSYAMPLQKPGEKTVVINAFDKAGNDTTESTSINILSIEPPTIDSYPAEIQQGETVKIQGHSYPNAKIIVTFKDAQGVEGADETTTDANGKFSLIWSRSLDAEPYTFTATVTRDDGATSNPSVSHTIAVNSRTVAWLSSLIINYLSLIIIIVLAVIFLAWVIMHSYHRLVKLRRKIAKDIAKTENVVHQELRELVSDLTKSLQVLNTASTKRELTKEEKIIITSLKRHIDSLEKQIDESLADLKKEAK